MGKSAQCGTGAIEDGMSVNNTSFIFTLPVMGHIYHTKVAII